MTNETPISDREREILRLVATGSSNQQIADQLNISIHTVKVHLRNIFGKIGAVSRTEATIYAIRNGLVTVTDQTVEPTPNSSVVVSALTKAPVELLEPEAELPSVSLVAPPEPPPLLVPPVPLEPTPAPSAAPRRPQTTFRWAGLGLVVVLLVGVLAWLRLTSAPAQSPPSATDTTAILAPTPRNERWTSHTVLPEPRQGFALAASDLEGRLYVIGGRKDGLTLARLDRYDPKTTRWVSLTDKPTPASEIQAVALRDKIYVPGGELSDGKVVTTTLEAYNPREQRWETLSPLPEPRSRYGLVVWEGKIYLLGGWDGKKLTADLFIYDPETDLWSRGPILPTPRRYADAVVVAGQIYLVGGEDAAGPLRDSLRLDPSAAGGRWENLTPLPQAIAQPHTASIINALVVIDTNNLASWQYDMTDDAWLPSYPLPPDAGSAARIVFLNTSLFFVASDQARVPGAVGEYRVIYTVVVPVSGSQPLPTP